MSSGSRTKENMDEYFHMLPELYFKLKPSFALALGYICKRMVKNTLI
jgi:hypothetical protein